MFGKKVIKEGEVQHIPAATDHYHREDTWKPAQLKLTAGGTLEISGKGIVSIKL